MKVLGQQLITLVANLHCIPVLQLKMDYIQNI
jgi:hypothetical protein